MDVIDSFLLQRPVKLCLFLKWILAGCRCDLHHLRLNLNKTPWHFHDIFWLHSCGLGLEEGLQNVCQGGSWWSTSAEFPLQAGFGGWIDSGGWFFKPPLRFVSRRWLLSRRALAFWGYWAWVPYPNYAGMPRNSRDRPCLFQQNWSDEMMPSFRGASIVATPSFCKPNLSFRNLQNFQCQQCQPMVRIDSNFRWTEDGRQADCLGGRSLPTWSRERPILGLFESHVSCFASTKLRSSCARKPQRPDNRRRFVPFVQTHFITSRCWKSSPK